jgi:GGDEF domain-containing protein
MAAKRTAPGRRLTEQRKARARLPLLTLAALLGLPLAGIRSTSVWICYVGFVILYSLWALRLCAHFSYDRRLGYLLCFTDFAIILPLLVWSSTAAVQVILVLICGAGLAFSLFGERAERRAERRALSHVALGDRPPSTGTIEAGAGTPLERAVRMRLGVFRATGSRFALVVLRVLRFEEAASYYGEESSQRIIAAVSRRGLRLLGPDAQHFLLPGGRVAFLMETEPRRRESANGGSATEWDPADVEGLAMSLGRKACEHLVDGHRVECVIGWASAPADGLNADDLMYVAEAGAQSTDAFRRVAGGQVTVPERARVATG